MRPLHLLLVLVSTPACSDTLLIGTKLHSDGLDSGDAAPPETHPAGGPSETGVPVDAPTDSGSLAVPEAHRWCEDVSIACLSHCAPGTQEALPDADLECGLEVLPCDGTTLHLWFGSAETESAIHARIDDGSLHAACVAWTDHQSRELQVPWSRSPRRDDPRQPEWGWTPVFVDLSSLAVPIEAAEAARGTPPTTRHRAPRPRHGRPTEAASAAR